MQLSRSLLLDYKRTLSKGSWAGRRSRELREREFYKCHLTRQITETNNAPVNSDVAWPMLERKLKNIFHTPTYLLGLDKDRVRKNWPRIRYDIRAKCGI
jgi:hypothetical protein